MCREGPFFKLKRAILSQARTMWRAFLDGTASPHPILSQARTMWQGPAARGEAQAKTSPEQGQCAGQLQCRETNRSSLSQGGTMRRRHSRINRKKKERPAGEALRKEHSPRPAARETPTAANRYCCSQAHWPATKTGTSVPSALMPVTHRSSVPIIKSTCVCDWLTPTASSSSASMP